MEFKSLAESLTGEMIALEITRNKDDDTPEKYDAIIPKLGILTQVFMQ